MCPTNWEVNFERTDFPTRIIMGRTGQPPITLNNTQGIAALGVETYERTALITAGDADVTQIANRILVTRSYKLAPRIKAVTIDAGTDPEAVDLLVAATPYKPARVACSHRVGDRQVFSRLMLVVGVSHTISPDGWTARLALDDAGPYAAGTGGRWQTTGVWKQTTWSRPP